MSWASQVVLKLVPLQVERGKGMKIVSQSYDLGNSEILSIDAIAENHQKERRKEKQKCVGGVSGNESLC